MYEADQSCKSGNFINHLLGGEVANEDTCYTVDGLSTEDTERIQSFMKEPKSQIQKNIPNTSMSKDAWSRLRCYKFNIDKNETKVPEADHPRVTPTEKFINAKVLIIDYFR